MDKIEIKLDRTKGSLEYDEKGWSVNTSEHLIMHIPSQVIFQIGISEDAMSKQIGTVFDFVARPVHVCGGRETPSLEELTQLGRSAILMFLQMSGCLKPTMPEGGRYTAPDLNL